MFLQGKTALVTGSTSGIGLAIARALAAEGAKVTLNGFGDPAEIATLQAELGAGYSGHDLTKPDEIAKMMAEAGDVDILVNNAGMQHRSPFTEFPIDAWRKLTATNVDSVFFVGRAVAQRMLERKRGKIVNICSVQSELGRPNIAPYAATKGAVKMLTKGMATDLGRHGIQVNGLGPGYFKTELTQALVADEAFTAWLAVRTPAGRWGEVEELGGAVVFLASEASSFVNGHILYVDGGITASL
jgi:gluconate 5-dehydrogenase